jgi:cytochrome c oxidase cbb3-type subunit 3
MAKVKDELREHQFDGIREYDNPLPGWWLGIFYVSIAFSLFYVPWVHFTDGNTIVDDYDAEVAEADEKWGHLKIVWDADKLKERCSADAWKKAEENYQGKCAACHRKDGGGQVGPAFTDDHYLHGGKLIDIAKVITEGVPAKGMIAWSKMMSQDEIGDLTCYVAKLRGKKVENPKAPQGEKAQ